MRGAENGLADGLSRMRMDVMEPPKIRGDWEDVAIIEETMTRCYENENELVVDNSTEEYKKIDEGNKAVGDRIVSKSTHRNKSKIRDSELVNIEEESGSDDGNDEGSKEWVSE